MDVQSLADRHGGLSGAVVGKAQEYLRMLGLKLQGGGNAIPLLGRPAACLELACEVLQEPCDSQKLFILSGGTSLGKHKQSVRSISGILRVQAVATITTASLCIKFGCPALKAFVANVHDEYKHRMLSKLTAQQQRHVDVTRPLFPAAVFFVCAQKANVRVDKNQLLALTMSQPKEFASVVTSIERLCVHALSKFTPPSDSKKLGQKRKRAGDASVTTWPKNAPAETEVRSTAAAVAVVEKTTTGNTRSLDQIKKLIQQQSETKPKDTTPKVTPPPPVAAPPSAATSEEYSEWKKAVLAKLMAKKAAAQSTE
ncbi:Aste57867_10603 [Aphanomyces stellatus]|uniref:Aste57867_10603 protein n=1 Tax=Aphanomyces stellatus TaxID=120398 RepID=A0A485KRA9_9STRA|nr:hypothetical protein As57867_010563 [Aphanomyces stellatus]VFT87475.1 Aste57867_10603 [Aphanomyces stellatus]